MDPVSTNGASNTTPRTTGQKSEAMDWQSTLRTPQDGSKPPLQRWGSEQFKKLQQRSSQPDSAKRPPRQLNRVMSTIDTRIRRISLSQNDANPPVSQKTPRERQSSMIITSIEQNAFEQKRLREEKLVQMIVANDSDIWNKLALANDSIIKSAELFLLIHEALKRAIQNKSAQETTQLLTFCRVWVDANWANHAFIQAIPELEHIVKMCTDNAFSPAAVSGETLHNAIAKYPPPVAVNPPHSNSAKDFLQKLLQGLLQELDAVNQKSYDALVADVARDITQFQVSLYCQITSHALITKKWQKTPRSIEEYHSSFNKISFYIVSMILGEPDIEKRKKKISFFLDVAHFCLHAKDLISPHCILAALLNSAVSRLKQTWEKVSEKHLTILQHLEALYSNTSNFLFLRTTLNEKFNHQELFVPNLILLQKDLTTLFESIPAIETVNGLTGFFNWSKLEKICSLIDQHLSIQPLWHKRQATALHTNFISHCVMKYTIQTDDVYHQMSQKIEPKITASTSAACAQRLPQ